MERKLKHSWSVEVSNSVTLWWHFCSQIMSSLCLTDCDFLCAVEHFSAEFLDVSVSSSGSFSQKGLWDDLLGRWSSCINAKTVLDRGGRAFSHNAWIFIYQVFILTFPYVQEIWVVTRKMWLWIQAAKLRFMHKLTGLGIRDTVRSQPVQRASELSSLLLCIKGSQLRLSGGMPTSHVRSFECTLTMADSPR